MADDAQKMRQRGRRSPAPPSARDALGNAITEEESRLSTLTAQQAESSAAIAQRARQFSLSAGKTKGSFAG